MTTTDQAPLVRDQRGAVLGVDWRRVPGMVSEGLAVPGTVPAKHVMPGDTIRMHGVDVVVATTRAHGIPGHVYLGILSAGGASVVHELLASEPVRVVAAGAFDR